MGRVVLQLSCLLVCVALVQGRVLASLVLRINLRAKFTISFNGHIPPSPPVVVSFELLVNLVEKSIRAQRVRTSLLSFSVWGIFVKKQ